jgi:hypothetical protein
MLISCIQKEHAAMLVFELSMASCAALLCPPLHPGPGTTRPSRWTTRCWGWRWWMLPPSRWCPYQVTAMGQGMGAILSWV